VGVGDEERVNAAVDEQPLNVVPKLLDERPVARTGLVGLR
jgi:hypothetical protein